MSRYLCGTSLLVIVASALSAQAVAQSTENSSAAPVLGAEVGDGAQNGTSLAASPAVAAGDIIVTGTRLRSGLTAPTPVTAVSNEQLRATSPGLISEALSQLPAFKNSSRPTNGTGSPARDNAASFLNLRGIGKERTLVLLDGRRFVGSTTSGVPDVALLPQDLVQRVDVVTGGASSAYGSDAVAGVVNFILDRKFTGLRLNAAAGIASRGDAPLVNASLTAGVPFAGGNGHFITSLEYFDQKAIPPRGRSIYDKAWGIANTGLASPAPSRFVTPDYLFTLAPGGLITTGPLAGMQFAPNGTLVPYNFGTNRDALRQVGGDGHHLTYDVTAAIKRYAGFARAQYEFDNGLTIYTEGSAAQVTAAYHFQLHHQGIQNNQFTIFNDNAFLPAGARAALGVPTPTGPSSTPTQLFLEKRINTDFPFQTTASRSRTYRAVAGADWEIGGDWALNAYAMHGENKFRNVIGNTPITRNLYAAVDAVVNPANGRIVCRSTLAGLDPGCVPLNTFGANSASQAAIDYILGESVANTRVKQDVASIAANGPLFKLPGGTFDVAIGAEYRREAGKLRVDELTRTAPNIAGLRGVPGIYNTSVPGSYTNNNPQPFSGKYNVKEGFVEVNAPVLADTPGFNLLSFNGAVRLIDYSTVGRVTTWKVGAIYEAIPDIRIRATRSRDIRAANLRELFTGLQGLPGTFRVNNLSRAGLVLSSGNPDLKPEKADTTTIGAVFRPSFIPGLGASVDYYNINLKGVILTLTGQQTIDQCATGFALACAQISETATEYTVRTPTLNLQSIKTSGVDAEVTYVRDIGPGRANIRVLATRLIELSTTPPGGVKLDRAGDVYASAPPALGGSPKWQGSLLVNYDVGNFGIFVQERFIGPAKLDNTLSTAVLSKEDNHVGNVFYTDLTLRYVVPHGSGNLEIYTTINNLFDRDPPVAPSAPLTLFNPTNTALYDIYGRFMTVGARIKF